VFSLQFYIDDSKGSVTDMADYKISNVVVSSYVADGIDLDQVAAYWPQANYNPMAFRAIAYTQDNPKTAQLIFDDGKVVSTGARSVKSAEMSVSNIGVELEKVGIPIYDKLFIEIDNIVARATLDRKLDLHHLAPQLENAEFDPAVFPGIIIKDTITKDEKETKISTLIFSSGKIVITGHKTEEELREAFGKIADEIEEKAPDEPEE